MKSTLALTVLGLSFLFSPYFSAADPLLSRHDSGAGKTTLADRDGNTLSDSLQLRLSTLSPDEPIAVMVTFTVPGSATAAQHAVGPFEVRREFRIIKAFAATMTVGQAKVLARVPGVFRVEEDFKVTTMLDAANRDFGTAAARSTFDATGAGVGICIVDTGVDPTHEQLNSGKVAGFVDFVNNRTIPYDDHGHGTHVAAIAAGDGSGGANAAAFQGVAPEATIYAAKVLDAQGSGTQSDVIAGVEWCATNAGVSVISMSLGSEGSSDGQDALSQAVNNAVAAGKVAVVAAGNSGDGANTVGSPGAAAQAITVGAVAEWSAPPTAANHSDGVFLAWFSSRGPTADGRVKPDIVAPGVSVTSAQAGTASGYVTWSGTSMATPFVSGTIALALGSGPPPALNPFEFKNLLMTSAQDRGSDGPDNDWGAGLLDGKAFLAATRGTSTAPTLFPAWHRLSGSVADNGLWIGQVEVTDTTIPLALTLDITGQPECSLWLLPGYCLAYEWSPDLDAELVAPNGATVLRTSTCPSGNECGSMGRQEILHIIPPVPGTYQVRVYPFADSPNNGKGGSFILDVSAGPLDISIPPPPLEASVKNPLLAGRYVTSGKGANKTSSFVPTNTFTAGQEIVLLGIVKDDTENAVSGAVVTFTITGPESRTISSAPSDASGMALARWQTVASGSRGKKVVAGTPIGEYSANVSDMSVSGYSWNGTPASTTFEIH